MSHQFRQATDKRRWLWEGAADGSSDPRGNRGFHSSASLQDPDPKINDIYVSEHPKTEDLGNSKDQGDSEVAKLGISGVQMCIVLYRLNRSRRGARFIACSLDLFGDTQTIQISLLRQWLFRIEAAEQSRRTK